MKALAAVALILLVSGWVSGESAKDKIITDYFEIELEANPRWGEGYNGWINYTETIRCKVNQTVDPSGLIIVPYEQVDYILGVRSLGDVIEPIGYATLVMTPNCYARVTGRMMYWATPQDTNITLVHLFKPEHSRLPAKQYDVQTPIPIQYVYAQNGITNFGARLMSSPMALTIIGVGLLMGIISLPLFFMYNKALGILAFLMAALLMVGGVMLAAANPVPTQSVFGGILQNTTTTTQPEIYTTTTLQTNTTSTSTIPPNTTNMTSSLNQTINATVSLANNSVVNKSSG